MLTGDSRILPRVGAPTYPEFKPNDVVYLTDSEIILPHLGRAEGARAKSERVELLAPLECLEKVLKLVFDGVGAGNWRHLHLFDGS